MVGYDVKPTEVTLMKSMERVLTRKFSSIEKESHEVKTLVFLQNNVLCAGDDSGNITIWLGIGSQNADIKKKKLHNSALVSARASMEPCWPLEAIMGASEYGTLQL